MSCITLLHNLICVVVMGLIKFFPPGSVVPYETLHLSNVYGNELCLRVCEENTENVKSVESSQRGSESKAS